MKLGCAVWTAKWTLGAGVGRGEEVAAVPHATPVAGQGSVPARRGYYDGARVSGGSPCMWNFVAPSPGGEGGGA